MFTLVGCPDRDQVPIVELNQFAHDFLASVRDETSWYKSFVDERGEEAAAALRPKLARPWRLRRWDGPFTQDEGIICLADGSLLHLVVDQKERRILAVTIAHFPRESCPGS